MIFNNLRLVDLSPELDLFPWQTPGRTLPMNFALSTDGNDSKVALFQIDFCFEHSSASQPEI